MPRIVAPGICLFQDNQKWVLADRRIVRDETVKKRLEAEYAFNTHFTGVKRPPGLLQYSKLRKVLENKQLVYYFDTHLPTEAFTAQELCDRGELRTDDILALVSYLNNVLKDYHRRGIVHLDVNLQNILMVPTGTSYQPMLYNFRSACFKTICEPYHPKFDNIASLGKNELQNLDRLLLTKTALQLQGCNNAVSLNLVLAPVNFGGVGGLTKETQENYRQLVRAPELKDDVPAEHYYAVWKSGAEEIYYVPGDRRIEYTAGTETWDVAVVPPTTREVAVRATPSVTDTVYEVEAQLTRLLQASPAGSIEEVYRLIDQVSPAVVDNDGSEMEISKDALREHLKHTTGVSNPGWSLGGVFKSVGLVATILLLVLVASLFSHIAFEKTTPKVVADAFDFLPEQNFSTTDLATFPTHDLFDAFLADHEEVFAFRYQPGWDEASADVLGLPQATAPVNATALGLRDVKDIILVEKTSELQIFHAIYKDRSRVDIVRRVGNDPIPSQGLIHQNLTQPVETFTRVDRGTYTTLLIYDFEFGYAQSLEDLVRQSAAVGKAVVDYISVAGWWSVARQFYSLYELMMDRKAWTLDPELVKIILVMNDGQLPILKLRDFGVRVLKSDEVVDSYAELNIHDAGVYLKRLIAPDGEMDTLPIAVQTFIKGVTAPDGFRWSSRQASANAEHALSALLRQQF